MSERVVVLSTVGAAEDAERIARALVDQRVAACVNVIPGIRSFYRWEGKVASDGEWLLVMKTTTERFAALREAVVELHPYDVPEVIQLPIGDGHAPYLEWIDQSVSAS